MMNPRRPIIFSIFLVFSELCNLFPAWFWQPVPIGTLFDRHFISHRLRDFVSPLHQLYWMVFMILRREFDFAVNFVLKHPDFQFVYKEFHNTRCPFKAKSLRFVFYIAVTLPLYAITAVYFLLVSLGASFPILRFLGSDLVIGLAVRIVLQLLRCFRFSWIITYRYPFYEIIYPKIRSWVLSRNSCVYQSVAISSPSVAALIRVLHLKPRSAGKPINCHLTVVDLFSARFEALSYVWGTSVAPHNIIINGKTFYVTNNLYQALRELRHPEEERILWIDAICINQADPIEKSAQVQLMQDIYLKATQAIIWLGVGSRSTSSVFNFARDFTSASKTERETMWAEKSHCAQWKWDCIEISGILQLDWWTRVWIIQEVVLAQRVIVKRGSHHVEWEALQKLLACDNFQMVFDRVLIRGNTIRFVESIQELRLERASSEAKPTTLLELALHFSSQSASFGSDKLYALLGLLSSGNTTAIAPDYTKTPDRVFVEFAVSCIRNSNDLAILSLASLAPLSEVSWSRDWRITNNSIDPIYDLSPSGRPWSASGTHVASYQADLDRRLFSLQGYEIDEIVSLGGLIVMEDALGYSLMYWEITAGGPWDDDSPKKKMFERTIVADCWSREPLDWRKRFGFRETQRGLNEDDANYMHWVLQICGSRRSFVTKHGRFGLGTLRVKKGDLLCVLLGGKVPFILRRSRKENLKRDRISPGVSEVEDHYALISEAYCDGLMYHEGDITEDMQRRGARLKWFHLL